ncbi:MAG: hypothetical protein IKV16_00910, partial [Clostridia bacterium]|nr:hypothetical protein [Clostridia bacterium]
YKSKAYGSDYYESRKHLEDVPHTFEAWVYASYSGAAVGTILGNYSTKAGGRFTFGINKSFCPELVFYDKSGAVHSVVFKGSDLTSSKWTHVVITFDEVREQFDLYLNGEYKQTVKFADSCSKAKDSKCLNGCIGIFSFESAKQYPFALGGDCNFMNPNYFRGRLQDVALYSDVLTADEIKGSYQNGVNAFDENLILYYDVDSSDKGKNIEDLSGNGYDLIYSSVWTSEADMQLLRDELGFSGEYAYSVAVIGDIQYATRINPETVRTMYQWLVDNKEAKNIQYAIGLGDITDRCQESEWLEAADALKILENAGFEYSLVRGNHDIASGIDSSYLDTAVPEMYDRLFASNEFYMSQFENYGGFYKEGSAVNTYRTIKFGNDDWLLINLDYDAAKSVREWACSVIEAHPDHRVIVATHDAMGSSGGFSTYGVTLWTEVTSKYANVELVLAGHTTWNNVHCYQLRGEHGNTVTNMLIDPQRVDLDIGGKGIVAMLYFREDGSIIDFEYYSTVQEKYYKQYNQFTIDLDAEAPVYVRAWDGVTSEAPSGEGTEADPYKIANAKNLLWMVEQHLTFDGEGNVIAPTSLKNPFEGKYFVQTADINLYSKTIYSMGYLTADGLGAVFGGNYDACGYTIMNVKVIAPISDAECIGFFGALDGATVKNLNLKEIKIEALAKSGILAGAANDSIIENCSIERSCRVLVGENSGNLTVGGFVGVLSDSSILGSVNKADLPASDKVLYVGGIAGRIESCTIYNSQSYAAKEIDATAIPTVGFACGTSSLVYTKSTLDGIVLDGGAHIHTANSFSMVGDGKHSAVCACGTELILECVCDENELCKLCTVYISGASVTVGGDVSINYYVDLYDTTLITGKTVAMQFTIGSRTVTVEDYAVKNGRLVFTLDSILPQQFAERIDAVLLVDGAAVSSKLGYSVRENLIAILDEYSSDETLCALVNDLLYLANEAQRYLDYNDDIFAAGGVLLNKGEALPTEADAAVITGNENPDFKFTDKGILNFDGKINLKIGFKISDLTRATITVDGKEYDKSKLCDLGDGKYSLTVDAIAIDEINTAKTVTLFVDGSEAATLKTGIECELYSIILDKIQIEEDRNNYRPSTVTVDEAKYEMLWAIYRYGISVSEYVKESAK